MIVPAIAADHVNRSVVRYWSGHVVRSFYPFDGGVVQGKEEPSTWFHVRVYCAKADGATPLMTHYRCAAGAAAGAGLPPVYTLCLNRYGYKVTLIGWGIITFVVTSLGLLCVRPRLPHSAKPPPPSMRDFDFAKKPLPLIMLLATMVQAVAHYAPSLYLPSFGVDFGVSASEAAMLASFLNLAQAIGQPLQGWLA
jgi:cyanate permease